MMKNRFFLALSLVGLAALIAWMPDSIAFAQEAVSSGSGSATSPPTQGFFDILFAGGLVGLAIIGFLFALSMTAAYLIFEQVMTLRKSELMPEGLDTRVSTLLASGKVQEAEQTCRDQPSFLSYILMAGISEVDGGWTDVEKALEDATAEQAARLLRKIEYLSVIGNIAPMVGLLGTVTGIIFAFQKLADTQGAAGASQLAEGIYQALVTTVGGLLVAIPSLGAFAILRNRVDQFVAEAAYLALHAFSPLKRRRRQSTKSRTATPPASPPPPPPVDGGRS